MKQSQEDKVECLYTHSDLFEMTKQLISERLCYSLAFMYNI